MALPTTFPKIATVAPFYMGIAVYIVPGDTTFEIELQRTTDSSGPNVAAAVTIATLPPAPANGMGYRDYLALDGAKRYYRYRHVRANWTFGSWSNWTAAAIPGDINNMPTNPGTGGPTAPPVSGAGGIGSDGLSGNATGDFSPAGETSIVFNGDCEKGRGYWAAILDNLPPNPVTDYNPTFLVSASPYDGQKAIQWTSHSTKDSFIIQVTNPYDGFNVVTTSGTVVTGYSYAPVKPGESYVVSFAGKASVGGKNLTCGIRFFSANKNFNTFDSAPGLSNLAPTTSYVVYADVISVPVGAAYACIEFISGTRDGTTIFTVDAISARKQTTGRINASHFSVAPTLTAGGQIQAAITAAWRAGGGVVDCSAIIGDQTIDVDIFSGITSQTEITVKFGPAAFSVTTQQNVPSGITLELNQTVFKLSNGSTQSFMFVGRTGTCLTTFTTGTTSITVPAPSNGELPQIGRVLAIFGHVPNGGTDNTTVTDNPLTSGATTVNVASTTGFPSTGYIKIENEIILYGGITATSFTTCTRGYEGTTAASHVLSTRVDRPTYDNYIIRAVTGTGPYTVTVDRNIGAPTASGSGRSVLLGPVDVSFRGVGILDGNKAATDQAANGIAIYGLGWARLRVEREITFQNWDHGGVVLAQSQDCVIDGHYLNMGFPASNVGFSVLFFNGCRNCTAYGDYENVDIGPCCDDRSTSAGLYDNLVQDCVLMPRTIKDCWRGVLLEGTKGCYVHAPSITGWTGRAITLNTTQWVTNAGSADNVVFYGRILPTTSAMELDGNGTNNSVTGQTAVTTSGSLKGGGLQQMMGTAHLFEGDVSRNYVFYINAALVRGNSVGYGVLSDPEFQSDVTSTAQAGAFRIRTQATSYTLTTGRGVLIFDALKGAGSTITTLIGLEIASQTGGSSNFAIKTGTGLVDFGDIVLTPATTTARASIRFPHGTAPTSPVNGDAWTTTAGLFIRINGATVGPLT